MAAPLSATQAHVEEWSGEDVAVHDVVRALCRLREESAHETEGPDLRTSVMTHMAWVPSEWEEAAVETLAGLGERHPSRGILLFPEPDAEDGIDATVRMLAFPLREQRRHIAAEVVSLRLRGLSSRAAASIVNPLLVPGLPVFLRWRGRPPFGEPEADAADRGLRPLHRRLAGVARCTGLLRGAAFRADGGLGHRVAQNRALAPRARGALAGDRRDSQARSAGAALRGDACSQAGSDRGSSAMSSSSTTRPTASSRSRSTAAECPAPAERLSGSELLSAELDEFGRDPVYEAAAERAALTALTVTF